jgi:soluble lytic murein transglycosylase-like protein
LLAGCAASQPRRPPRIVGDLRAIEGLIDEAAARHAVDPVLVRAVVHVESGFRTDARSSVGARGLMQLMPKTAASLARRLEWPDYDIEDPAFNIEAGTAYLAYLLGRFDGDEDLALAAYNTGPTRVHRWVRTGRPLPAFSRRYIAAVEAAKGSSGSGAVARQPTAHAALDRSALRDLVRERLYGTRSDEAL